MKLFIALAATFLLAFSVNAGPKQHHGPGVHKPHYGQQQQQHNARRFHQNRWRHRYPGPRRPYFVVPFFFGW